MTPQGFRFATFLLDLARHRLVGPSGEIDLRPKSFEVLAFLLARAGRLVTKAELIESVWGEVIVTDDSLTRCISDVRLAIGDGKRTLIRTVAKLGYIIDVPVTAVQEQPAVSPSRPAPGKPEDGPERDKGGRRPASAVYVDLREELEGLAREDAEAALSSYEGFIACICEVFRRYGATVQVAPGEGIAGLFGVPLAHEDHAARACQAAIECRDALGAWRGASAAAPVRPRIGIASGIVVFRALEGVADQVWSAMGQTVDEARRLGRAAGTGATLVSDETRRLAEGRFVFSIAGPSVDATSEGAYHLAGSMPRITRFKAAMERGLTRFVGRDAELEQLRRAERFAVGCRGQIVAVIGEAGVGKSRLAYELASSLDGAQGWRVLDCAAVSYGTAASYLPLIELLRGYFGIELYDGVEAIHNKVAARLLALDRGLGSAVPALLALLDVPVDDATWSALDPGERRHRTLDAIVRLLLGEARTQPLLLIVEDLHWADAETQALLDALADSLAQARLLLVLTYRPEYRHGWANKSAYTQIRLDTLAPEITGQMLDALLGKDPALERLKHILVKRGNPFFLEEAVRTLAESGTLVGERASYRLTRAIDEIGIPATVQAMLAARIDRLDPVDRRVLEVASAVGRTAPLALLLAVTQQPETVLRSALNRLQSAEFVYQAGLHPQAEVAFRHALVHEVAYGGMLQTRRRELHAKIVDAMETLYGDRISEHTERLAYHARRGELGEKAVHYLRQAGLKAAARSALIDARNWFEQALDVQRNLPETTAVLEQGLEIRLELRGVLFQLGEAHALLALLREAETIARQLGDERRRSRVAAFMTSIHTMLGQLDAAVSTGQSALQAARELGELELRINAANYLVQAHYYQGNYDRVLELAAESLSVWPDHWVYRYHVGNPAPASVFNRAFMAMSLAQLGRFAEAAGYEAEAIALAEPTQNAFAIAVAHVSAPTLHTLRGDWSGAKSRVERFISVARTGNIIGFLSAAMAASAWILAESGTTGEASSRIEDARRLLDQQAAKGIGNLGWSYCSLGRACHLLGRIEEARGLGERALALCGTQQGFAAHALHLLGDIAGEHDRSASEREAFYRRALSIAEPRGMRPLVARCHSGLAKLYQSEGRREKAEEHVRISAAMQRDISERAKGS